MASIVDWQNAGIGLKVELSETDQLTLVSEPFNYNPFKPGGQSGVPLNWQPGFWGTLNPNESDVTFNTSVGGVFSITPTNPTMAGNGGAMGCTRLIAAKPNTIYQFDVEVRCQPGKSDCARYVALEEYNPVTGVGGVPGHTLVSTSVLNIDNTSFELVSLVAPRPLDFANGFTHLRIRCDGARSSIATVGNWGIEYQKPELYERALSMPVITWRDITCDVKSLTTRYGREQFTNRFDVATMQMVLDNPDGRYSYANPHPFKFGPGRQVRVTATYDGITYPMYYGITDGINDGVSVDGLSITNVTCVDVTTIGANKPQPISGPTSWGGARTYAMCNVMGYLYTRLDSGVLQMKPLTPSNRTIRDEMGVTADSEGGAIFSDREGYFVFKDRRWHTTDDNLKSVTANLWAKPTSEQVPFDFTPDQPGLPTLCVKALITEWNLSRVINSLSLANEGGTARHYENRASIRKYGERTYQRHDFVLSLSADLDKRADDIMAGYTEPVMRLRSITFRPDLDENDWSWTLAVFLNWLVRVWYQNTLTGYGWLMVTHVQSIEHRITPTEWETTLALDQPIYQSDAPVVVQAFWDGEISTGHDGWDIGLWS